MVARGGGGVSDERGTPVAARNHSTSVLLSGCAVHGAFKGAFSEGTKGACSEGIKGAFYAGKGAVSRSGGAVDRSGC